MRPWKMGGVFQTWNRVARLRRVPMLGPSLYRFAQWFCGRFIGHQISPTEWGYGGGAYCDVWCRWCDHLSHIPLKEHPRAIEVMNQLDVWPGKSMELP